jgi:hypothetical protein
MLSNLPWLLGTTGVVAFDCIIFVQFALYKNNKPVAGIDDDEDEPAPVYVHQESEPLLFDRRCVLLCTWNSRFFNPVNSMVW